jgi:hypothetical protein
MAAEDPERAMKPIVTIDGARFVDFHGFVDEFNRTYVRQFNAIWNGNLDAFNDYLDWLDGEYTLVWLNAEESGRNLGHAEMVRWLAGNIQTCHPDNIMDVATRIRDARLGLGPTLFDWLVQIIREDHPQVELRLT